MNLPGFVADPHSEETIQLKKGILNKEGTLRNTTPVEKS